MEFIPDHWVRFFGDGGDRICRYVFHNDSRDHRDRHLSIRSTGGKMIFLLFREIRFLGCK